MEICIISPDFPTDKTIDFIFVEQLCRAFCSNGFKIQVIAPQSITKCLIRRIPISPKSYVIKVKDSSFTVYRPKYITLGNLSFGFFNFNKYIFDKTVINQLKKIKTKPSIIYGHFWQSVRAAYPYANKYKIPLFVASGEERVSQKRIEYSNKDIQNVSKYISGIINVSTNNQQECIKTGLQTLSNSIVIPNCIDSDLFNKKSRRICREKLGISQDYFIVAYVGQMTVRKGAKRVDTALSRINNDNIKAFFIGKGDQQVSYKNTIINETIQHTDLPTYLSAADIFVLPTLNEGCCNAIIEALACGLPVISSDLPFNYDVLNKKNSILIDPNNIDEIKESICKLYNDRVLLEKMSVAAIETAKSLTLNKRADKIIDFIKHQINND